jgi:hypothetical protein
MDAAKPVARRRDKACPRKGPAEPVAGESSAVVEATHSRDYIAIIAITLSTSS